MPRKKNYQRTLIACYLGFITQSISSNFAPLLFLTFQSTYDISLGKIALIPTAFYLTQLFVDILCGLFVDRIGYRKAVVASELLTVVGLAALTVFPELFPDPFLGILTAVILYATGSGLIEVLVSPIVEACPFEHKETVMSFLHSFYCWGAAAVILLSTIFFSIFGIESWKILALLWTLVPLVNIYNFATCPMEPLVKEGKSMTYAQLFRTPLFFLGIVFMLCAGASEIAMAQWASAYAEAGLGLTKSLGDLLGPFLFAVTMGASRAFYGKYGQKINLTKFMLGSAILCLICYLLASLAVSPLVGLAGCIFCGFSVGIMWPGTISIFSKEIPLGGTAMFALLAMAGDVGGSVGPSLVGMASQAAGDNMHVGMALSCIFPLILIAALLLLGRVRSH